MATSKELLSNLGEMNYIDRISLLRDSLPEDLNGLYITHLTNLRYLTGFSGSNGAALITQDDISFFTDGRYTTQSHQELKESQIDADIKIMEQGKGFTEFLYELVNSGQRIGFEADTLSFSAATKNIEHIDKATLVPTSGIVESLRIIKQPGEVDRIRAACRIADEAFENVKGFLKEFPTEKEFARVLDRKMVDLGAEGNSFETIVACGTRGALVHGQPSDAKIEPNQMIVVDFGCKVEGYCSDMTRTVSVGEPDSEQVTMWNQVIESQRLGRESARAGVSTKCVDAQCREYLKREGVDQYFTHGTGHGVGLDIHEAPRVSFMVDEILQPGYIITVEPGIYIEGKAGVRIEDTLCITQDGAEVLTTALKELVIV